MALSTQEKFILYLLAAINFTHIIDFMIMMPLGNQLMRYFHISPKAFSYLVASYTISAGISGFLMAFFVDRFNRKTVLLTGYLGFVLGTIGCGIAPTYEILMAMRITAGFFGGLIGAQVLSIIGDLIPFERRGEAMGVVTSAFAIASIVGVPFGLYFATKITWHAPFLIVGAMGAMLLPFVYLYLPNMGGHISKQKTRNSLNPLRVILPILDSRQQQLGILMMVLMVFGQFVMIPYFAPYMVSNVGFTEEELPLMYLFGGAAMLFAAPVIGKLADRYGKFRVLLISIVLGSFTVLALTNLPAMPIYLALCITSFFFMVTGARSIPAQAITTALVPAQQRGSYMSISGSMQQLAMGIAASIAGQIVTKDADGHLLHYAYTGYLSVFVSVCALWIAFRLRAVSRQADAQATNLPTITEENEVML